MRTRTRNFSRLGRQSSFATINVTRSDTGQSSLSQHVDYEYQPNVPYYDTSESITDELNVWPPGHKKLLEKRIHAANRLLKADPTTQFSVVQDLYQMSSQVHRCSHTKTVLSASDKAITSGKTVGGVSYTYSHTYAGLAGAIRHLGLNSGQAGVMSAWNSVFRSYSASGYYEPDWFALLDRWHDSCNSAVPSSTVLGESIVENGVFVDAFKTVLNPSRTLVHLLKWIRDNVKKKRRFGTMGSVIRTAADANLGFQFGIAPAVGEIKNIFEAHRKVQRRLLFLRSNTGGYVPIRVRQTVPSAFSNESVTYPMVLCDSKETVGVISALAKVRPDIDFIEDWQAYVQYFGLHKFIGLAWELVPFSFVLDWVSNAGEYVNKFTAPKFGSPFYNIRNICHSKKTVLKESMWIPDNFLFSDTGSRLLGGPAKVASREVSTYDRLPGLPRTSGSIDFSRLGTFHAIMGTSLLIQKVVS